MFNAQTLASSGLSRLMGLSLSSYSWTASLSVCEEYPKTNDFFIQQYFFIPLSLVFQAPILQ